MADTLEAPVKSKKPNPFATLKKPDTIIYRLIEKNNMGLRTDTPEYPPYIKKKNTDVIDYILPKDIEGLGKEGETVQTAIRYIHGEKSIFVYEQEKNGRDIPENVLHNQKNDLEIINGDIRVRPSEKTKIQFLDYASWNLDSPYKSGRVQPIIARLSEESTAKSEIERMRKVKDATDKAFEADDFFMAAHCEALVINLIDYASSGGRTADAVRKDYIKRATDDPDKFLSTFKDVKI